ncbi:MAG: hypothetical protein HUJ94_02265 [Bacteroidales bacterium]|nr:hypothetical protein [Bacteroidales bacterium]
MNRTRSGEEKTGCGCFSFLVAPAAATVLLLALCHGCVQEDRVECPAYLTLSLEDAPPGVDSVRLWVENLADEGCAQPMHLPVSAFPYTLAVNKGNLQLWCSSGDERIEMGEQCPRLYLFGCGLNLEESSGDARIAMKKSWCRLTVTFLRTGEEFNCCLRGGIGGYVRTAPDYAFPQGGGWKPAAGAFLYETSGFVFNVDIPRQTDSSLILDVLGDGSLERCFALGEYIAASGYDWSSPALEDLTIAIDLALHTLSVRTESFSCSYDYLLEI